MTDKLVRAEDVLDSLQHWSIVMDDGTEWCDLTEAMKAIRNLPPAPAGEGEGLREAIERICDHPVTGYTITLSETREELFDLVHRLGTALVDCKCIAEAALSQAPGGEG